MLQETYTLETITQYMQNNFSQPLTIADLAQLTTIHPSYFSEAFKKQYQTTVTQYLSTLRLNHAKFLLRNTSYTMQQIAEAVGYKDEFYLSRKFYMSFGIRPSNYRQQHQKKIVAHTVSAAENLLALGIIPYAAPMSPKWASSYYQSHYDSIHTHLPTSHIQTDTILENSYPDYIVSTDPLNTNQPSIALNELTWQAAITKLAKQLDCEALGRNIIVDYQRQAQNLAMILAPKLHNEKIAILRFCDQQFYLYSNPLIHEVLEQDLHLHLLSQQNKACNTSITLKEIHDLQPFAILLLICPDQKTRQGWLTLQHHPLWQALEKQCHQIPASPWYEYSAVAAFRLLDEISLLFTGKSTNYTLSFSHGE